MHYKRSNSVVMKKYRLLRNNKESGPFSAEELIQSGLKAYDLIWAEGKSAAWRYPCEIDELKAFAPAVEEQPFDRFFKRNTSSAQQEPKILQESKPVIVATPPDTAVSVKKEKPRIKIKADCTRIDTTVVTTIPAVQNNPAPSFQTETIKQKEYAAAPSPAWESMWMDWEQEKKAVKSSAVAAKFAEKTLSQRMVDEPLETKFSQSLDDIKERYIETVLNKKHTANNFDKYKNQIAAAVLILAILVTGVWVGVKWSSKTDVASHEQQQNIQLIPAQEEKPVDNAQAADNEETANSELNKEQQALVPETQTAIVPIIQKAAQPNTKQISIAAASKKVVNKKTNMSTQVSNYAVNNQAAKNDYIPAAQNNLPSNNEVVQNKVAAPQEASEHTDVFKKTARKEASVSDYVAVETYSPAPGSAVGVEYNISNVSDIQLDLVTIDLQYYDSIGKYLRGETVYLKNLPPGRTVSVHAPDNRKAAVIDYKVSMVSSEKNDVYLIAD